MRVSDRPNGDVNRVPLTRADSLLCQQLHLPFVRNKPRGAGGRARSRMPRGAGSSGQTGPCPLRAAAELSRSVVATSAAHRRLPPLDLVPWRACPNATLTCHAGEIRPCLTFPGPADNSPSPTSISSMETGTLEATSICLYFSGAIWASCALFWRGVYGVL